MGKRDRWRKAESTTRAPAIGSAPLEHDPEKGKPVSAKIMLKQKIELGSDSIGTGL